MLMMLLVLAPRKQQPPSDVSAAGGAGVAGWRQGCEMLMLPVLVALRCGPAPEGTGELRSSSAQARASSQVSQAQCTLVYTLSDLPRPEVGDQARLDDRLLSLTTGVELRPNTLVEERLLQ